ncbi:MAG: hypothetical protein ACC642_00460, partial [Pseudomonadales bacterium]
MRHRIFLSAMTALLSTALFLAPIVAEAGLTSMRGPLFSNTDEARTRAEDQNAALLAPASFSEAMDYYQRAEATFKRAGSVDSIRRHLTRAETQFNKSVEAAAVAAIAFDAMIQARNDALSS